MNGHISAFPSAWVARYHNVPVWPGKSILPVHDGDMAWQDELADKIIEGGFDRMAMLPPSDDWHYRNVIGKTDINPHQVIRYWPADLAGELLRQWKAAAR